MKKLLIITAAALLITALATIGAGFYMLSFSLSPDANRHDTDSAYRQLHDNYPVAWAWADSMKNCGSLRDTFVTMPTGERHHALYARNDSAHGRTAVIVHGYKDCAIKFLYLGRMYHHDLGFNILMPDLHAHGLSEGDAIQMGWKDRLDVLHWMAVAERLFRRPAEASQMVVHGVSMGAATTMNVSGEELPQYVRWFVADCGYTGVWDEFALQLKEMFGMPQFPLMHVTSMLCNARYGWTFEEASPIRQVARCNRPMLFIHGDSDTFVPYSMAMPLYKAKQGEKSLWTTHGTRHARSFHDYPEEYVKRVKKLLGQ